MPELFDVLTFDSEVVENVQITTTDPNWTDLITLVTPNRAAGLYELSFSLQFTLNSTSQAFIYRFSLDGGASWGVAYEKEVKDRHNTEVVEVVNLIETTAIGNIDVRCQVTKEGSADCEVIKGFISCERKG
jgi:hypothetical protein